MTETLDPYVFPDYDPYSDPERYRQGERYWWHESIRQELIRLRDECRTDRFPNGFPAYSVSGIAGNIKNFTRDDVVTYCRMMITWGELVKAEPLWNFEPEMWVALAE